VPALDGVRGVALLGVLLFHADGALPGGYLASVILFWDIPRQPRSFSIGNPRWCQTG
jgi:peptidoglycan/LPS O-acetylase OafA/YrhL